MYKDADKQREAVKQAMRRKRAKGASVIPCDTHAKVIPEDTPVVILCEGEPIKPKRGKDIKCFADLPPDVRRIIERMSIGEDGKIDQTIKANRTAIAVNYQHQFPDRYESTSGEVVGVASLVTASLVTGKPGDADYNGTDVLPPGVIWESEPGAARKIEERERGR